VKFWYKEVAEKLVAEFCSKVAKAMRTEVVTLTSLEDAVAQMREAVYASKQVRAS
jgi:hypothetical protein